MEFAKPSFVILVAIGFLWQAWTVLLEGVQAALPWMCVFELNFDLDLHSVFVLLNYNLKI